MDFLHIVAPIIVGGIIGYFTNYLAIKMMFRPRKAVYIGKHKLPFTPGIIPKNQKRIARAVGDAVSEQLLTKDAVLESLEKACDKSVLELAAELYVNDISVNKIMSGKVADDVLVDSASTAIAHGLIKKASQVDMDSAIGDFGDKMINSIVADNPMLAILFGGDVRNAIYGKLSNAVRNYINEYGENKVKEFVSDYIRELSRKPLKDIIKSDNGKDRLKETIKGAIESAVKKYGAAVIDCIDIKRIVAERVEAMKPEELEELVLSVMKQELQAVINLGAVIGALIGIVNIFI